jgi:hypothetical protein
MCCLVLMACVAVVERSVLFSAVGSNSVSFETQVFFTRLHGVSSPNIVVCKINIVKISHFANLFTHYFHILSNSDCRKRDVLMDSEL